MAKRRDEAVWWILYPLRGFDLAEDELDLSTPLFGDATVISRRHARALAAATRINEYASPGHDHEAAVAHILGNATLGTPFHSFIAVKRAEPRRVSQQDPADRYDEIERLAARRARRIAALLSLSILANHRGWLTCGLVEQTHDTLGRTLAMVAPDVGGFYVSIGGERYSRTITDPRDLVSWSREQLQTKLHEEPVAPLTAILAPQRPRIASSLEKAVVEAAIHLTGALHQVGLAAQLLGSVTALEILVSDEADSYVQLKRRLTALIGEAAFCSFEGEDVLKARHQYVHRGVEPKAPAIALHATGLALCCLLRYAEASSVCGSRTDLLAYLDFLAAGRRVQGFWGEAQMTAFSSLVKHRQEGYVFPFFARGT